ncbi:hypothetical protein CON15_24065 [Bacillus cereus]|uniref:hypothetical protein n=1 Tax=Bacillus cereus TaxID=1396 RepID=UPI000BEB72D1|nr:hypothetical protein [Bacillus cereus]PDZ55001.1 hypothetical protein CON15_24065 [Bacillus cereus]PFI60647.1 hypothetical protein COI70_07850 [Bacillus cereus]PGY23294.1 hypothetical protein COE27_28855 [Bacillus cereus]PGZ44836.1 hypothetical protein COE56_28875 [Bacillus anthracis]
MDLTKLTKQEQSVVIGTFIAVLGEQVVNERINADKLEKVSVIHNELHDNTTPKQRREAMISLLDKTMEKFLVTDKR